MLQTLFAIILLIMTAFIIGLIVTYLPLMNERKWYYYPVLFSSIVASFILGMGSIILLLNTLSHL